MQLSVRDAARYLAVPEDTVYRWINDGDIPFTRINDQYRLSSTDLLEWAAVRGIHVSVDVLPETQRQAGGPDLAQALEAGGVHTLAGGTTRDEVLEAIVKSLPLADEADRETLHDMVVAREVLGSTGIGEGIAIPHVRAPIVVQGALASISLWYLSRPVDFGSPDGRAIDTVFLLITPAPRTHLQLLSRIASALHDPKFRAAIKARAALDQLLEQVRRLEPTFAHTGNGKG